MKILYSTSFVAASRERFALRLRSLGCPYGIRFFELFIFSDILDLNREWKITVIMIEHDMGVVMDISKRIAVLDFVLHFIIDYSKTKIVRRYKIKYEGKAFWCIQGVDQIAHYSCYIFYVLLLTNQL